MSVHELSDEMSEIYSNSHVNSGFEEWSETADEITIVSQKTGRFGTKKDEEIPINGFHKIKIMVNNKIHKLEVFETGYQPGLLIRNAVSGYYYNHRTGTYKEQLYFKVVDTCNGGKNPLFLFYDSPEQYERHYLCSLSKYVKKQWLDRYNEEIAIENSAQ